MLFMAKAHLLPAPFFEIGELLVDGQEKSFLISGSKFNSTDSAGSMGSLCCDFEEVSRFDYGQEVNILLEREGRLSKNIPCSFASLVLISFGKGGDEMRKGAGAIKLCPFL